MDRKYRLASRLIVVPGARDDPYAVFLFLAAGAVFFLTRIPVRARSMSLYALCNECGVCYTVLSDIVVLLLISCE